MIKKVLIGSAAAMALGTLVFGGEVFNYATTWGASVRDKVKSEIPVEFQVERARKMVENLVGEVHDCMHVIAEQQVEVEYLEREVERKELALAEQKDKILALRDDLGTGKGTFTYASRTYSSDEVKRDLSHRFKRFKAARQSLERDKQILASHQTALRANEDKLETLTNQKRELEVKIEQLDARVKSLRAAEAASTLEFDDTRLARAKKMIRELNKQLDVREKILDAEGKFTGLIPVDSSSRRSVEDITEEIDAYFDASSNQQSKPAAELEPAA